MIPLKKEEMRAFRLTIRTKLFLLIMLLATGGFVSLLFYLEAFQRVKNANYLKQDVLQLSGYIARIQSIVPELKQPSDATTLISTGKGKKDELSSLLEDITLVTEQISLHGSLTNNLLIGKAVRELNNQSQPYKQTLLAIYEDYRERNLLAGQLSELQKELDALAMASGNDVMLKYSDQFGEVFKLWRSGGEPFRLEQLIDYTEELGTLVESGKQPFTGNTGSKLEMILSDSWSVLQRLQKIQSHLSPLENTGLLGEFADHQDQVNRKTSRLQVLATAHEKEVFTYALVSVSVAVGMLVILLVGYLLFFTSYLRHALTGIRQFLTTLVSGQIPESISLEGNDEFTEMAATLDTFAADLQKKAQFANGIGQGNLEAAYVPLSDEDLLGNALIGLQKNLQEAQKSQQEHEAEEHKRRWINEGLTKFAEVLRLNNNNIDALSDQIIQNTVIYLDANQGGLFLLDESDASEPFLELVSSFAYNRKKYLSARIKLGEGLIGTCAIEKEPILLTEVPDEYITITSGLGESNPRCIVLVPLKLENKVLGVIEIATFVAIQPHQLEFLEKVAESIASTIATVRINMRTEKLLEQSQHQSQVLADQEEEMRQNMEELQATQEESKRREAEITGILNAIHMSSFVLEFDMLERVTFANERFCALIETSLEHLRGKKYGTLFSIDPASESHAQLWEDLKLGTDKARVECIKTLGQKQIWVSMNLTPIRQYDNKIIKVLCIAHDITDAKIQEQNIQKQSRELARKNQELESLHQAVDNALLKCAYDMNASITEANENYLKLSGFNLKELVGKDSRQFIKPDEQAQFDKIWAEITKDKSYTGVIKRTKPTGEELWLMSSFTPVKDEKGNIYKVYYLGQDITERKLKYKLLEEANKEIERLKAQLGGR
jgi:PAS domain S-box-containing protein